jgi:hypothetical protein
MPPDERSIAAYLLENKINEFTRDKAQQKKDLSDARYDMEGETLTSRYWTKSAQDYHPRSTIYEFRKDNVQGDVPAYEIRPKKMAEMARDYHEKTQDMDQPDEYSRILATSIVLDDCNKYLTENQHAKLDEKLNIEDINTALKMSKNGSAPGLDGLPYEFYSWLQIRFEDDKNAERDVFDILGLLTELYSDIETHGILRGTNFNAGWMCPVYKNIEATMVTSLIGRSKWDRKGGIKEKGWRTSSILANTAWRMAWLASLVSPCNLVM